MNSWQKREKELKEEVCGHEFGKITQSNITCKLCGKQVHPYYYGYDTGLKDGKARMTQAIQKCRKLHEQEMKKITERLEEIKDMIGSYDMVDVAVAIEKLKSSCLEGTEKDVAVEKTNVSRGIARVSPHKSLTASGSSEMPSKTEKE